MTNGADPDQLASEEAANWSGSTLFTKKAWYLRIQQDKS